MFRAQPFKWRKWVNAINANNVFQPGLKQGFTLAEALIGLVLMAFIFIPFYMTAGKGKSAVVKQGYFRQANVEISQVIDNLIADIQKAHIVKPTSYNQKLLLDTFNAGTNTFLSPAWRITPISSANRLQYSPDNEATYYSPYPLSATTDYTLSSGDILYCGPTNNCTEFQDTNGNGSYGAGDAAGALASGFTGTALSSPNRATKIVLRNWVINRSNAFNNLAFTLPNLYINLPLPAYASSSSTHLTLGTFDTNSGTFPGSGFNVRDVAYDAASQQLFVVGNSSVVYRVNNEGVFIGPPITVSGTTSPAFLSVAAEPGGNTLWILNNTNFRLYKVPLTENSAAASATEITYTGLTSASAVVFDPGNSSSVFVVGLNSGGSPQLLQLNASTGATQNTWNLPAGLSRPAGAEMDPISGDLLVWNQTVTSNTITLYRIQLGTAPAVTSTTTTYNLANIGSSTTASTYFGLGVDSVHNRLYLSDQTAQKVFYILPQTTLARSQ